MDDVQRVYRGVGVAGIIAAAVWLGAAAALLVLDRSRMGLARALVSGSAVTLAILVALGVYMALDWTSFFTSFHNLFLASGSWTFEWSDTLIRLFPIQFWIDIATLIVGLVVGGAILLGALGWVWLRRGIRAAI
jgi:integral membrane protein (TIGR01906 family)